MEAENLSGNNASNYQNPKLAIVRTKNQIDYFMQNYAVYRKSGIVIMEVIFKTGNDNESYSRYFELTPAEYDEDNFRELANQIRENPSQFADRELL